MTMKREQQPPSRLLPQPATGAIPLWLANLCFFGLLMAAVLVYSSWQMHRIDKSMQRNGLERSRLVTGIIEENMKISGLTSRAVEDMTYILLNDKAHFIDYLDSVEPLHEKELTALAEQSSLTGITLVRQSGTVVSGPPQWLAETPDCTTAPLHIQYNHERGYAYMMHPAPSPDGDLACVIVGLDAARIFSVQKKTSLPAILNMLSKLPGIHYIRLQREQPGKKPSVSLKQDDYGYTAETKIQTGNGLLIVGLDAARFIQRRNSLRNQFILFAVLLCLIGFFLSWLLYQYQKKNLSQIRTFERMMAREHEAATLGRATATIAHEVRNPLNAINMGLQRLSMESTLDREQEQLIRAMREAVNRTSSIITGLQKFTTPLQPEKHPLALDELVRRQLALYQPLCRENAIVVNAEIEENISLNGDRNLLAELVENILKNAIEARVRDGGIQVSLARGERLAVFNVTNNGFMLSPDESRRLGEPYFTTKTRGTGLGLAITRRIAEAHGGRLRIMPDFTNHTLTIRVELPLDDSTKGEQQ